MSSRDFVYGKFSEFYSSSSTVIPSPSMLDQRELGFLLFKERIMLRHKSFESPNGLKLFLSQNVPSDVYRSCAYYENPDADMNKKGWLGADLVFDIDADHIPTSCNQIHDKTWLCELCLNSAKEETTKLIDILQDDFGFSDKEMHVFFSGHRGYHIHVENDTTKTLDTMARKEIVDYVSGIGLSILNDQAKDRRQKTRRSRVFTLHDFGWNKRLKRGMQNFFLKATKEDLKNAGIKANCDAILQNREIILKRCMAEGRWDSVYGVSISSNETWIKIAKHIKNIESAKIDTVVTTDIHRLIRLNGTLHGKTGLRKVEVPSKTLEDFDPFKEAVAFKEGEVKVVVSDAPEFRLGGNVLGPYKNQTVELPTAAAVLLICKGRAEVTK